MSIEIVPTPTSRCRSGIGRVDITPPVGMYHRMWGAAKHDRSTGVHQPLTATALIIEPSQLEFDQETGTVSEPVGTRQVIFLLDHCLFRPVEMEELRQRVLERTGLSSDQVTFTFSHTHASGLLTRSRADMPGGAQIANYLDRLPGRLAEAFERARAKISPMVFTYGQTVCGMANNRDYYDETLKKHVCGFNPLDTTPLPLHVVKMTDHDGLHRGTIISYPCHPTTLAWQNTLVSPDYVGALRELVERETDALCLFLNAPCGDIGPREGFVGDVQTAERNGRQVGYAALSVLETLPPAGDDFHYTGAVVSGATIGTWEYRPQDRGRTHDSQILRVREWTVDVPYLPGLPTEEEMVREEARQEQTSAALLQQGDAEGAATARALAERCRRTLERIRPLPAGANYPLSLKLLQLGDAFFPIIEGEPYFELQRALTRRFPGTPILPVILSDGARASYLPRREDYEKSLYQAEVALLAPGALETAIKEFENQIAEWGETQARG